MFDACNKCMVEMLLNNNTGILIWILKYIMEILTILGKL